MIMATAILARREPVWTGIAPALEPILAAWRAWRQRSADARALARAGRLGPRLLADMGIEDATARALVGDWNDLRPNGWLVRRR